MHASTTFLSRIGFSTPPQLIHLHPTNSALSHQPVDVQVVPHDERFHSAQIETLERVVHHEAVLASVLVDLVEVLLQEPLLL